MYRIGIDVGGTFTDLVAVDDLGKADPGQGALDPGRSFGRRPRRAEAAGRDARDRARGAAGRDRSHRPRHDGRHQCAARAQGRAGRAVDDRRPSRRDRDARGAEGRPLQSAPAAARAARPAQVAARRARAAARRWQGRDAARPGLARPRHRIAERAKRSRRSRSATCTPTATRATSSRPRRRSKRELPGVYVSLSSEVLPQIKEYERVSTTVVNAYVGPGPVALSGAARAAAGGSRLPRPDLDHPVAWRGRADRRVRAARGRGRAVRAGRRRRRQRLCRAPAGGGQSDPVRHGRDQHRHLADRRRPADPGHRPPGRRPCDRAEQPRHRQHRRRRRLDRPGRCRRHPACRPAERRRGPGPRLLRRRRHAPRRSPTPIWCSAISIRRAFSAAGAVSTARPPKPRSTISPPRSGSTGWPRRAASTGSSTRRWPRG